MRLKNLTLSHFRNFVSLNAQFHPGINVLLGANGQGKTNLIESLFVLTQGSSFRPGRSTDFIAHENPQAFLHAQLEKSDLDFDVQLKISDRERSTWLLNGKKVASTTLKRTFPTVLFSPESLAVIKEGPEQRREFLDEMLASHAPGNAQIMSDFRNVLRTRNRVLKNGQQGVVSGRETRLLLESLEKNYLEAAACLTQARLQALEVLQDDFHRSMQAISNRSDVDISVDYLISEQNARHWGFSQAYDFMHKRLRELAPQELQSGTTLVGPHKHDIRILFNGKDSRFFCSQGQQRALILSFKMARIVYHYKVHKFYPFLLLDDVLSELDAERRESLVTFLKNVKGQIFITTTDFSLPQDFGAEDCAVFEIHQGVINS